jgi:branched-chain amino acid transport system permease protein
MPPLSVWVDAIVMGSIWVMVASGLVLVFSIMGILNFAHGQFYMFGAFVLYAVYVNAGMNYFVAAVAAAVAMAAIGVLMERFLLRPIAKSGFIPVATVTLGAIYVFDGLATSIFGAEQKPVTTPFPGVLKLGDAAISYEKLAVIGLTLLVMLALYFVIMRTKFGIKIRAAAQDPLAATLYGVNPGRLASIVMAIGCGLAALAGAFMAPVYYVDPYIGQTPLIMSILAIVIGGLGSLGGAVIGGLLLGISGSIGAWYIGPYSPVIAFALVIVIILFRPEGLFGAKQA